jgi:ABC-type transport system substrate-binding protein
VVKWNFDRKIAQQSPYVAEIPFADDPVAVVDDYTITITLTEPSFIMYNYLCGSSWVMYSKDFVESHTDDDLKNQGIGTGPYVLKEYLPADRIVVEANPDYWQEGMPFLDGITMRIVSDANTRLLMLEAGEVQYIKDLSIQDLARLEGNASVVTTTAPSTRTYFVSPHGLRRPFDDVRVRQALNYGVDRQAMNDAIYEGKFIISTGVSTATVVGSVDNVPYPYDPEKAMALLDEAGVVDTNNDGFREVDGEEKEFVFWTRKGQRAGDIEIAETFVAYMAEIGLNFKIEVQDAGQYFTLLNQPFGEAPYYDITNQAPSNFIADMSYPLQTMYSCTSWPGTAFNYAHYCNEDVDALITAGNVAGTIEERNDKYAEAQELIWEDAVVVWLFDGILTVATTPDLKGVFSDGAHNVWQVKYAWFAK